VLGAFQRVPSWHKRTIDPNPVHATLQTTDSELALLVSSYEDEVASCSAKMLNLKERFPTVSDRHLEDALTEYKGHAGRAAGHIQKMYASGDITPAFNHTVFSSAEAHSPAGERTVTGEPSPKSVAGERTLRQARVDTPTRLESTSGGGFADLAKVRNWADLQMWIANGEVPGDAGIGDTRPPAPRTSQEATQPEMQMPAGVGV